MDQLLGVQNKSKGKKSSLFFKQITIEEAKIQSEVNDAQDQIGDSNHHFKNKNCEPQKLHQGDQDVSLSSFLVGMNEFLQESQKDIKTTNQSFCKAQQEEPLMQIIGQSSNKFLGQTKHNLVLESEIKANLKINEDIEQENQESQIIEESFNKSNTKDSQSFQDQIQSKILFSKNKIAKNDTKNKISQNSSQCRSISHSRMKINSHVLVQDDIFFEKDNKKLETKVNLVLKSQYQLNQEHNTNSIYKQNLQRAAKIIKMLFSSSINRVLRIRQNNIVLSMIYLIFIPQGEAYKKAKIVQRL
ncbi:cation channel family protein (macronuclear) [Tetrahymena thermophila SB210]|uniref:Cation channel family protein n=1 Tax=Tetrahymena thermophila (strain SB210) TaxID=312017 RepID=Q22A58_TETTS|nr:cation channel family protein [Tetrahymena thermophila SB210]EAR82174.2 cation channel family protein [Tetrahymena thermophila SB210]|eukprot:XP_001029837.2 cation channel family protein [Tetrahymena thermophila SB210]